MYNYKSYLSSGKPPFITTLTSFIFMTNCFFAYYKEYYLYSGAFLFLVITSLLLDLTHQNIYLFYGLHMLYQKMNVISKLYFTQSILTIVIVGILYHYGYNNNCLCFDKDECITENYMAFVHIISSLTFNTVILT